MPFRFCFWTVVVAGAALMSGCRASQSQNARTKHESAVQAAGQTQASTNSSSKTKTSPAGKPAFWKHGSEIPPSDEDLAKAHAHYALGVIHDLNDEADEATKEFSSAAEIDLGNESLVIAVASRFIARQQFDKAVELLSKAAMRPDTSGAVFAELGSVYSQRGKLDEAIEANRTAIRKSPDLFAGHRNLFLNHLRQNRKEDALKVLDEAATQTNAGAEFFMQLGELYLNYSRQFPSEKEIIRPKILAALNRAHELKPDDPQVQIKLADGFSLLGETDKAVKIYRGLLRQPAGSPLIREAVRARLAEVFLRGDDPARAAPELEALLRDDPTNPQANFILGQIAYKQKQFGKAEECFSKTVLLNPGFKEAYYLLAEVRLRLDKPDDTLETLDRANSKFPGSFISEFLSGLAYARKKEYQRAITRYIGAETLARAYEPERLKENFYFELGAAHERNGEYEDAERSFKKALELAPDFDEALNYLGYMWADRGENLEEARTLIEKALKQAPTNAAYLDSLGWVLFKLKQPEAALEQLLKAEKFSEQPDATLYDHLGEIYSALHQMDKARDAWKKSLAVEKNEEIEEKLKAAERSKAKP